MYIRDFGFKYKFAIKSKLENNTSKIFEFWIKSWTAESATDFSIDKVARKQLHLITGVSLPTLRKFHCSYVLEIISLYLLNHEKTRGTDKAILKRPLFNHMT